LDIGITDALNINLGFAKVLIIWILPKRDKLISNSNWSSQVQPSLALDKKKLSVQFAVVQLTKPKEDLPNRRALKTL